MVTLSLLLPPLATLLSFSILLLPSLIRSFHKPLSSLLSLVRVSIYHIHDLRRIRPVLDFDTARTILTHLSFTLKLTLIIINVKTAVYTNVNGDM